MTQLRLKRGRGYYLQNLGEIQEGGVFFLRKGERGGNKTKFAGFSAECKSTAVLVLHVFLYKASKVSLLVTKFLFDINKCEDFVIKTCMEIIFVKASHGYNSSFCKNQMKCAKIC